MLGMRAGGRGRKLCAVCGRTLHGIARHHRPSPVLQSQINVPPSLLLSQMQELHVYLPVSEKTIFDVVTAGEEGKKEENGERRKGKERERERKRSFRSTCMGGDGRPAPPRPMCPPSMVSCPSNHSTSPTWDARGTWI